MEELSFGASTLLKKLALIESISTPYTLHALFALNIEPWNRCSYRGTSLIRNCPPLGPYSMTMPRDFW